MPEIIMKNQTVTLEITAVAQDGNGLGRYPDKSGIVVFVPRSAPGDILRVKIVKILKNHAFAIIENILEPSPLRIINDCPIYGRCGGCGLRHVSYEAEIKIKDGWVRENISRIGGIDVPFDPPLPSPEKLRYRNKAQYPVRRVNGKIRAGFFAARSHELIPVDDCLLQPDNFHVISDALCAFMEENGIEPYDEATNSGLVRALYLRRAQSTGAVMVCIVINGGGIPKEEALAKKMLEACPSISTALLSINRGPGNVILGKTGRVLFGGGKIGDVLCGIKVRLSPRSFYQVNHAAAEILYRKALEYASPEKDSVILDLFCGTGTIGLSMAHRAGRVIGVETVEDAVLDARENAIINGIKNAEFICADASSAGKELKKRGAAPNIVLLDPPRKGVDENTLRDVAEMAPSRIVYISCNSSTLARDMARLAGYGYTALRAGTVDMFPGTNHTEAIALLSK